MAASVRDVAAHAGVSVGTVSNVLNRPEKVSAAVVARVTTAIDELGFVRNEAARQLRAGRSSSIGLVVLDAGNPFFGDVARGAEDIAAGSGLSVILGNSDDDPVREAGYLDLFESQRVQGVLISPIGDVRGRLAQLRERGTPVVLVDRSGAGGSVSSVSVDDVAGGRLAAQHLVDAGRRRIVFVGGPRSLRQVAERLAGAREVVESCDGATFEVVEAAQLGVLDGRAVGETLLTRDPAHRPDGVFAANDLLAVGLLQAFVMSGGTRVPDDVALVGYDDIAFASAAMVPLTSVRQPARLIGSTAVDILLREAAGSGAEGGEHVVFQPELVVRASTGAEA